MKRFLIPLLFVLALTNAGMAETWVLVAEWNEKTMGKDTLYQRYIDSDSINQMDNIISARFYVSSTYSGGGHLTKISVDCNNGFFTNEAFGTSFKRRINFFGKVTWQGVELSKGKVVREIYPLLGVQEGMEGAYDYLCKYF